MFSGRRGQLYVYSSRNLTFCIDNQHKILQGRTLGNAVNNHGNCVEVGYTTIVERAFSPNIEVSCAVVELIGKLALTSDCRKQMIKAGGIKTLVDLALNSKRTELRRKIAASLANLLLEGNSSPIANVRLIVSSLHQVRE
jgi:hypothetical protein